MMTNQPRTAPSLQQQQQHRHEHQIHLIQQQLHEQQQPSGHLTIDLGSLGMESHHHKDSLTSPSGNNIIMQIILVFIAILLL